MPLFSSPLTSKRTLLDSLMSLINHSLSLITSQKIKLNYDPLQCPFLLPTKNKDKATLNVLKAMLIYSIYCKSMHKQGNASKTCNKNNVIQNINTKSINIMKAMQKQQMILLFLFFNHSNPKLKNKIN